MTSYYLVFGASGSSAKEVAEFLHDTVDIEFKQVADFFRGWNYTSLLYVSANFSEIEKYWLEFEDQEFEVIIYVQTAQGKSKNRLSEHKWFKSWMSRCDRITLLSEEIIDVSESVDSQ